MGLITWEGTWSFFEYAHARSNSESELRSSFSSQPRDPSFILIKFEALNVTNLGELDSFLMIIRVLSGRFSKYLSFVNSLNLAHGDRY